jgi:prevent-host-death family protein
MMASKVTSRQVKIPKNIVSAYEAKTHFSALLERVSKGESITITKHGQEVAKLSPIKVQKSMSDRGSKSYRSWHGTACGFGASKVVAELQAFSKGKTLGKGMTIRDLIEEGRR